MLPKSLSLITLGRQSSTRRWPIAILRGALKETARLCDEPINESYRVNVCLRYTHMCKNIKIYLIKNNSIFRHKRYFDKRTCTHKLHSTFIYCIGSKHKRFYKYMHWKSNAYPCSGTTKRPSIDVLNIFLYFIHVTECNILIVNDHNTDDTLFCVVNVVWRLSSRPSLKEDDILQ